MTNVLPLHSKDLLPEHRRDRSLYVFMHVAVIFYLFWELGVVMPRYHDGVDILAVFHLVFGCFIVFNILGNVYMLKRVDASGKQKNLPAVLLQGWTYCYICQMNAPPRTHHCSLCKECILKRDHHCMFTGCCVGYLNQRYYIMAIAYIFLGALYSSCYQWEYCSEFLSATGWWAVLCLIAPHFALVSGSLGPLGFLVVSLHTFIFVATLMTCYMLLVQLTCVYRGQTSFERREGISIYNLGWRANFREVFGSSWFLTWISPWLESTLPGDGVLYTGKSEGVKDI